MFQLVGRFFFSGVLEHGLVLSTNVDWTSNGVDEICVCVFSIAGKKVTKTVCRQELRLEVDQCDEECEEDCMGDCGRYGRGELTDLQRSKEPEHDLQRKLPGAGSDDGVDDGGDDGSDSDATQPLDEAMDSDGD